MRKYHFSVIEELKTEQDKDTGYKIPEEKKPYKSIENLEQYSTENDDYKSSDTSNTYTTWNFDITSIESEYAFNVSYLHTIFNSLLFTLITRFTSSPIIKLHANFVFSYFLKLIDRIRLISFIFQAEKYGNINKKFHHSNESDETEIKNEISAKKEIFPIPSISKIAADPEKDITDTSIASDKLYIQSFYNASDLSPWKVY